ncbi:putative RNA-binding protein 19 [Dermatophagoides pteronyssinus]|uniref:putative RNA-binding protein 19 n=1 Tax=Dermatophagoides pteronyssinus TaxID=6956 RepID=UPI003F675454
MSRIFIENLPKNITQEVLKQKFAEKGEITDIQLRQDKRNAFIGYKQPEQAQNAVDYFNKTFIHTSKITVKICDSFRLNKKAEKSQTIQDEKTDDDSKKKKRQKIDPFEEVRNDPEFEDFLRLQRNIDVDNKCKEIWKDDVIANVLDDQDEENDDECDNIDDDDDNQNKDVEKRLKKTFDFTVKIRGLPYKIKKSQLKEFLKPIKPMSMRFVPHVKGIAYVSFKNASDLQQAMIKHRGFIDGHRIEITNMEGQKQKTEVAIGNGKKIEQNKSNDDDCDNDEQQKKEQPEPISESGRIFIRNLSYTCTEDDLRELFEKFGTITELHMPIDSYTKKPKGFAFVTYMFPEHAIIAFNQLDKTDFQGRLIHLLPAHMKSESTYNGPPPPSDDEMDDDQQQKKSSTFKQNKNEENRQDAQNTTRWNTLFVRSNAVADIMSKNLNMNKLDLLTQSDRKSGNAAVRMALGEAQIVNEIKQFLIKNQVHLESFERGIDCPRSRTRFLVKNLPADTQEKEIQTLFEKYGLINRVILPPYGLTAIVEMQEPNEAKFAFKKLAYSNFKHYPLFLEWAPEDVFAGTLTESSDKSNVEEKPEEIPIEDGSTIFVKNLNFDTSEEDFRKYFEDKIGPVHSATIATKKTPKGILSMGYGFIQFYQSKMAKEAIKKLQNSKLDGHQIEIKLSNRTTSSTNKTEIVNRKNLTGKNRSGQKQTGSKICVKNIPFEATVEDVRKIFSTFGQIKSIRIPKKLAGTSQYRGFGFVDFTTKEDAKRAFDALSSSTHLYGRPLVLEWAKNDSVMNNDNNDNIDDNDDDNHRDEGRQIGAKMVRYFRQNLDDSKKSTSLTTTTTTATKRLRRNDLLDDLKRHPNNIDSNEQDNDNDDFFSGKK